LDRLIPADEAVLLKGATFLDFENQVEALVRAVAPTALEERAALAENAQVGTAGRCPHCGSGRVYLERQVTQPELRSPHGLVVVPQQQARCRACGGSFSPSGAGLGLAERGSVDGAGGGAGGARDGGADV
jgi:DNA-directed RNA polymerase subunit RPC12/RpoP